MTTESLLDKLRKIKAHAESAAKIGSEAEADAFTSMLQRLLLKHKLEMTDIEVAEQNAAEPVDEFSVDWDDVKVRNTRIGWIEVLAGHIARAHFCRILVVKGSSHITLVGRKSDAKVAEYMLVTLVRAIESMAAKEHAQYAWLCYKKTGSTYGARGFKASFINAFISRIIERLEEERRTAEAATSTALMRFNSAAAAVDSYINDKFKSRVKGAKMNGSANFAGAKRGRAAADAINLRTTGIESSSRTGELK